MKQSTLTTRPFVRDNVLRDVVLSGTLVEFKALFFKHVGPPLPVGLRKSVTHKIELPEVRAR